MGKLSDKAIQAAKPDVSRRFLVMLRGYFIVLAKLIIPIQKYQNDGGDKQGDEADDCELTQKKKWVFC